MKRRSDGATERRRTWRPVLSAPFVAPSLRRFVALFLRQSAIAPHGSASESAPAQAAAGEIGATSLSALLSRHILRDGETVILVLRPSVWFILLSSLRFLAAVAILMIGSKILDDRLPGRAANYLQAGVIVMIGRLMWAVLQWMGRIYILTDLRAVRLSGVLRVNIEDCPLRKVARARLVLPLDERFALAGSIEIIPFDEAFSIQLWQTVSRPRRVHEIISQTIAKAKQGPK